MFARKAIETAAAAAIRGTVPSEAALSDARFACCYRAAAAAHASGHDETLAARRALAASGLAPHMVWPANTPDTGSSTYTQTAPNTHQAMRATDAQATAAAAAAAPRTLSASQALALLESGYTPEAVRALITERAAAAPRTPNPETAAAAPRTPNPETAAAAAPRTPNPETAAAAASRTPRHCPQCTIRGTTFAVVSTPEGYRCPQCGTSYTLSQRNTLSYANRADAALSRTLSEQKRSGKLNPETAAASRTPNPETAAAAASRTPHPETAAAAPRATDITALVLSAVSAAVPSIIAAVTAALSETANP